MAEKKNLPTFDELKDERYRYHYSRSERMSRRKGAEAPERPRKKPNFFGRMFGGNQAVGNFFVFYVLIGILAWGYLFLVRKSGENTLKKDFNLDGGRKAEARLILRPEKRGLNLLLNNGGRENWLITEIQVEETNFSVRTNIRRSLEAGEFDVVVFPTPDSLSNISRLKLQIR